MADLYLVNLDLDKIESLKSKAYEGRKLSVAVYVDKDNPEDYRKLSISHGNKKNGEEVVYLGNCSKAFVSDESIPF